ncbi:MAG: hypothetical protein GVY30_08955 [Chloroflexi bacterium]|jgi:hypothetical protein|nr:hypothetical protein [Chloroflexota bacterium]
MSSQPKSVKEPVFDRLIPAARQRLVELGAPLLITEAEGRLALAERKITAFEQKYNTTFEHLQDAGLPNDASIEMHEDFIEWAGWQRTYEEAQQTLEALQPFLEQPLASPAGG